MHFNRFVDTSDKIIHFHRILRGILEVLRSLFAKSAPATSKNKQKKKPGDKCPAKIYMPISF